MITNRFAARGSVCLLAAAAMLADLALLGAQTVPNLAEHATSKAPVHRKTSPAKALVPAPAPDPPPAPPAPEPPKWPLNDAPAPPSVHWDSHGLQVGAPNSSLRQILDEVATATGAKVEGLGTDERVFGEYGPGPARDVISQILHGSNYNVLMLGDEGEGTPREIILSQRTAGGTQQPGQAVNHAIPQQEDDSDQPTAVAEPEEPNRLPINPAMNQQMNQPINQPGPPMTPQQRMLEMQRQQMQMQQQQQQNMPVPVPPQQQ